MNCRVIPILLAWLTAVSPAWGNPQPPENPDRLDIDPEIIEDSPVLRRWMREIPNVWDEIANDPSFRTRLRVGYSQFASGEEGEGLSVGVEDWFVPQTRATLSGDYYGSWESDRESWGVRGRYYLRPLGRYVNVAPTLGYRQLRIEDDTTRGAEMGVRLLLVLSRGGAADVALTQTWVAPGTDEEVGLSALNASYAIADRLRLSADIQRQNAPQAKETRLGLFLEWMP